MATKTEKEMNADLERITKNDPYKKRQKTGPVYSQPISKPALVPLSNPNLERVKWYEGDTPTYREALGRIIDISGNDSRKGQLLLNSLNQMKYDPSTPFYNRYASPTNKAVNNLKSYGFDTSKLTKDYINQNSRWISSNLIYNGTTNTPSKPGKKATTDQMIAYELYQWNKSEDDTLKAEKEYNDAVREARYWALRTDRNYSDEQIIAKVNKDFAKKYPTLAQMQDKTLDPIELNRGIDYSNDTLYGAIWSARNPDANADINTAIGLSAIGAGNRWEENKDIAAKLLVGEDTYSPYSVGSTLEAEGLYFGVQDFDQKWIDENRARILGGNDETAKKYFANVVDAEHRTQELQKALDAMNEDIEELVKLYDDPEDILDALKDNTDYNGLFNLDKTLEKGDLDLVGTTRAIDYRWQDIEAKVREKIEAKNAKDDALSISMGKNVSETDRAIEDQYKKDVNGLAPVVKNIGTNDENVALQTGKTTVWQNPDKAFVDAEASVTDDVVRDVVSKYADTTRAIRDYNGHKTHREDLIKEKEQFTDEWKALTDRKVKTEAVGSLTREQFERLVNIDQMPGWEDVKFELELGEGDTNEDGSPRFLGYDRAVDDVYRWVTQDSNIDPEKAKLWADFALNPDENLKSMDFLTDEESKRLDMLDSFMAEHDQAIKDEDTYLEKNKPTFETAQRDIRFMADSYADSGADEALLPSMEYVLGVGAEWVPTEWTSNYALDTAVSSGEMTSEAALQSAGSITVNSQKEIKLLTETLATLDKYGVKLTDDERKNVNRRIESLKRDALGAAYFSLDGMEGFSDIANETAQKFAKDEIEGFTSSDLTKAIRKIVTGSETSAPSLGPFGFVQDLFSLNDMMDTAQISAAIDQKEWDRFYYLLGTDGKDAALNYLGYILDPDYGVVTARSSQATQDAMRQYASENGWQAAIATANSFITNTIGAVPALAYEASQTIQGKEVSPINRKYKFQDVTTSSRAGAKELLQLATGGKRDPKTGQVTGGSKLVDMLYDALTSSGDSMINGYIMGTGLGSIGAFLGKTKIGNIARKIGEGIEVLADAGNNAFIRTAAKAGKFIIKAGGDLLHASTMGMNAASAAYREAIIRGAKPEQATAMAIATFWAETGSEAVTFSNLNEAFLAGGDAAKSTFTEFVKEIFKNGAEEFFGEGINEWIEQNADRIIMGELSNYDAIVKSYTDQGYPESLAKSLADKEVWQNVLHSGAVGFLSSGIGTTSSYLTGAASNAIDTRKSVKRDTDLLVRASNSDQSGAAVAVATVLGDANGRNASRASGQYFVNQMAGGDPGVAAASMQAILKKSKSETIKRVISMATLTEGTGHDALQGIIDKVKSGQGITTEDVNAIEAGVRQDMKNNPDFLKAYQQKILSMRVANKTIEIASTGENKAKIDSAKKEADAQKENLANAEAFAEQKQAEADAAASGLQAAEAQYDPAKPETAGPLEQQTNKVVGANTALEQSEQAVEIQQKKTEDSQKNAESVNNEVMTQARIEAEQQVNEEVQQEAAAAQEAQANSVAAFTPLAPVEESVQVLDNENRPVTITGVYDVVYGEPINVTENRNAEGDVHDENISYGRQLKYVVYTTEDGRLVTEKAPTFDNDGNIVSTRGYGDVDTEGNEALLEASESLMGQTLSGSDDLHPDLAPAHYFPSSFASNVNGRNVQMIGLAGKTDIDGEVYPVIMGMDGNLYTTADENFDVPFDYVDVIDETFDENEDSLEEIPRDRITEANVNAGQERQESSGQISQTLQGTEREGDNEGQLLSTPERDGELRDNSDVGSDTGEETNGQDTESVPGTVRPDLRRVPERQLSKQLRSKLARKGVTSTELKQETDSQRFSSLLDAARENNPYKLFVDPQTPEELAEKGAIMLRSRDGKIVGAVGTNGIYDGDIFAVCKEPSSKAHNASRNIIISAVAQGGNKLDCYNGTKEKPGLPIMYSSVGMIPVARVKFNRAFHENDGWNYERDGEPDVIFWMLKPGETAESIVDKYDKDENEGGFHLFTIQELESLPVFDDTIGENGEVTEWGYDKAWAFRDDWLAKGEIPEATLAIIEAAKNEAAQQEDSDISGYKISRQNANAQESTPQNESATSKQAKRVKSKLKSPQQIAKTLVKRLGFGDYMGSNDFGSLPKRIRAYWDKHGELVAVKDRDIGNINITAHEIGHGIGQKFGIKGTQQMINNLINAEPEFANAYTKSQLADEALAEFMWRYLVSDEMARSFAGNDYFDTFERTVARDPKTMKALLEAKNDIREWINADLEERTESLIRWENTKDKVPFMEQLRLLTSRNVDSTAIADAVDKFVGEHSDARGKLRLQALFAGHSQKRAVTNLTDSLTDANGTIIGDGLGARLAAVGFKGTEENIHLLEKYALWLHSLSRDEQGKQVFDDRITTEERVKKIKEIQETRPDIVKAEQAWQEFRHDFLQAWMVDTGYWSQKFLDHLEEMYPHYVPTFRVRGTADNAEMTGFGRSAKRYTMHAATGGTEDIYSPMYSFIGMVDQITGMVATNQVAQLFDQYYQEYEGMGEFARQIHGKENTNIDPVEGEMNARQNQLFDLLENKIDGDLMEQVLEIAKSQPGNNQASNKANTITVQREDGTTVRYEIHNPELYKLLAGVQGSTGIRVMQAVGALTRTMSMLTTGSNPLFAARNAMRDFQNSVNYGSWASNYGTGAKKWLKAFAEVARESDDFKEYEALGGGGWTRIQRGNAKSMGEISTEIFGDDKSNVGKTAKWLGKKLWDTVTLERLNEIIEQTSRFAEYKYGQHDRSTAEGRKVAFQAAQDATVDFSRSGNSETAYVLKKLVPFFGASLQGVYRTGRSFTEAERGRLGARITKTIVNTALMSALSVGLILRDGDDDDKEEFMQLSDGVKANHLILPNPLKGQPGQPPFLRIPLAQDPLGYLVHSVVTNAMANGSNDDMAIGLAATADVILDNLNPLGSGTVFQPFIDVSHNRTWYGSNLVRTNQSDWVDKASQYNEDTPDIFKALGRITGQSPEVLEYLATQYTGFIGSMAIPALTINEDGSLGGFDAVMNSVIRKWTADPLTSNDVTKNFYDKKQALTTIIGEANADRPQNMLLRSLSQGQVNAAYEEAKAMTSTGGIVYEANKAINDAYKKIDQINANNTLSDAEKYTQTSKVKLDMLKQVEAANEQMQAFYKKYIQGETLVDRMFGSIRKGVEEGKYAHVKTPVEEMPVTYQNDIGNAPYMDRVMDVYNGASGKDLGGGKAAALPHPSYTFTLNTVEGEKEYSIPEEDREDYEAEYKSVYERYVNGLYGNLKWSKAARRWDTLNDEERYEVLKSAASYANGKMKEMFIRRNKIKLKK